MKPILSLSLFVACLAFINSCKQPGEAPVTKEETTPMDIHSFAKPQQAAVKHLSLDLLVDFNLKKLSGTASYDLDVKEGADSIYLDTRDLDIHQVMVDNQKIEFKLGPNVEWMGQALSIPVNENSKKACHHLFNPPGC